MNRDYLIKNSETGEERIVNAFSARDALYQTVGWRGISYSGLDYRSGNWETSEPFAWWHEHEEEEEEITSEINICCNCGTTYQADKTELKLICIEGVITCECGNTLTLEGDGNERRYESVYRR